MKKLIILFISGLFCVSTLFSQSYEEWLKKAKDYENQKRWCYALGAYYDAMGTEESPEIKQEAYEGYKTLKDEILSGNPGRGKYNAFSIHDEWKNLLIDAEKYGSSNNMYEITIGELKQGDLDYATKTATYNAEISFKKSNRYNSIIQIIRKGYYTAYKDDWKDLPEEWPLYSASSQQNNVYNVNGVLIYARVVGHYEEQRTCYLNAFAMYDNDIWQIQTPGLYDYKFNIVDETGKELIKGKRWLLGDGKEISFQGITPDVMDLIDNGKAYVNPIACYLEYGKYNSKDANGGRSFIKNFPEVQLILNINDFICGTNKLNKTNRNVNITKIQYMKNFEMVRIKDMKIEMQKTEVTQELYNTVMGTYFSNDYLPVSNINWYDSIYFCNKLSEMLNLIPVYSVNGNTNVSDWKYQPNQGEFNEIMDPIVENKTANGFRLPKKNEWEFAAKSSSIVDDEAWYSANSNGKAHPVAQKKQNEFGLYDMQGNVSEMCWDCKNEYHGLIEICGENYDSNDVFNKDGIKKNKCRSIIGFRVVRSISE